MPVHAKRHHKAAKTDIPAAPAQSTTAVNPKRPAKTSDNTTLSSSHANPDSVTLHANVTGIIYLHQSPDYASPLVVKIPDATSVRILQKGDAWYKVSYNGQEGYVIKGVVGR